MIQRNQPIMPRVKGNTFNEDDENTTDFNRILTDGLIANW
jgi:hypothetical protein